MDSLKLSQPDFERLIRLFNVKENDIPFFFQCYDTMLDSYLTLGKKTDLFNVNAINNRALLGFLVNDYYYRVNNKTEEEIHALQDNDKFLTIFLNSVLDKYSSFTNFYFDQHEIYSFFAMPISSLNVFINFVLNKLTQFSKENEQKVLIYDLLNKAFLLCKTITQLLTSGFETEAFVTWRTLHETECIIRVLVLNSPKVTASYLKHMQYSLAYNNFFKKEVNDELFVKLKAEMKEHDLKSKDLKRFIEYGWLYDVDNFDKFPTFKLNFRDGLEVIAGLDSYNKIYQRASEFVHATPLTLISRRDYFATLTLIVTYEAFIRLEEIFNNLYLNRGSKEDYEAYQILRNIYRTDLLFILKRLQKDL